MQICDHKINSIDSKFKRGTFTPYPFFLSPHNVNLILILTFTLSLLHFSTERSPLFIALYKRISICQYSRYISVIEEAVFRFGILRPLQVNKKNVDFSFKTGFWLVEHVCVYDIDRKSCKVPLTLQKKSNSKENFEINI